MKENAKNIFYLLCLGGIFLIPAETFDLHSQVAEAREPKTLEELVDKRSNFLNKVRGRNTDRLVNILIVPGHDNESWGTEFRGQREVDFNRELSQKLYQYLLSEPGINPVLASGNDGYNEIIQKYFDREKREIEKFIKNSKKSFSKKLKKDDISVETDFHNVASESVAFKLYGINSWVNEHKFDLVIHIHFNDHAGRKWNEVGEYTGFSIYTPGELFGNHELSRVVADSVFDELKNIRPVSNLDMEKDGVMESHELIAVGSNDTVEAGSILIEYGYIYENIFTDPEKRPISFDYLAYATYSGIMNSLNENPKPKLLPIIATTKNMNTPNNLEWQYYKALNGAYPPLEKTFEDCPITGYFGECSLAVK